jgi:uncharacterized membrane protein YgcG
VGNDNTGDLLETQPHPAPTFDTGPYPEPLNTGTSQQLSALAYASDPEPPSMPARSVPAAGDHHYLKWWKLVLVIVAVWIPAAAIGLGLFYWWHLLADKTPADFVVLVYVVVCAVASLMLAMVPGKPLISALAIAVMSAAFASVIAAAPLYGHYFCQQIKSPCVAGIIPY